MGLDNGIRSWLAIGSKASTKKNKTTPFGLTVKYLY